jgi:diguanylate cyclase (GGDEF)-like protein/PAS domain S-box-containing protein
VLTLLAMAVLAVTTLLTNRYIVAQQHKLTEQALPIEGASREMVQAMSELIVRQQRLFSARNQSELSAIPSRLGIEQTVEATMARLQSLTADSAETQDALHRFYQDYRAALRMDLEARKQVETNIVVNDKAREQAEAVEALTIDMQMDVEAITGRLSLEKARVRREMRQSVSDGKVQDSTTLIKRAQDILTGTRYSVEQASGELERGITELTASGYLLLQATNEDRLNDLRDNEIRLRLTQVEDALATMYLLLENDIDLRDEVSQIKAELTNLADILIENSESATNLRSRAIKLNADLEQSRIDAADAVRDASRRSSQTAVALGRTVVAAVGAVVTLFIFGLVSLLIRRISTPLTGIRGAMHRISGGDLSVRLDEGGGVRDEFSELAADFNSAASTMQTLVSELAQAKERLQVAAGQMRALLNGLPDGVITFNPAGRIISANPAAERIFCVQSGHLENRQLETLIAADGLVLGESDAIIGTTFQSHFAGGRRAQGYRANGSTFPVWISTDAIDGVNRPLYIAVVSDMSTFEEAEQERLKSENLFRTIYENVPVMIAGFDADGKCVLWNRELEDALGWSREAASTDRKMLKLIYPDAEDRRRVLATLREHDGVFREFSPIAKDGTQQTHLWANFVLPDGLAVSVGYDITARKQAEERLRSATLELETLLQNALVGIAQVKGGRLTRVNRRLEELFGFGPNSLEERDLTSLFPVADMRQTLLDAVQSRLSRGLVYEEEVAVLRRDGSRFWCALSVNSIDLTDLDSGSIWLFEDVTARREIEEKLRYLASFDVLTKLPNRVLFHDRLRRALLSAERQHHRLAVLYIDLDHFKHVNDSLGHGAGDMLLCEVARRLSGCVRGSDTIARLGGDEFTVILDGIEPSFDAGVVAQKIIRALVQPCDLEGNEVTISPSIGISIYPDDGREMDILMRNADAAMYHAKQSGRNAFRYYSPDMNVAANTRLRLSASLRRALDNREYFLEYQPQIEISTKHIIAVEALLRWQNPELGRVMPDEFIPILEETGLIVPVGDWVLSHALEECKDLVKRGICVAVNISGRQFRDQHLGERIASLLHATGTPPELLELEITETVLMSDTDVALRNLERLNKLGVRISIDDFGMGYSSLAYLKRFPIDALKVDRSFIRDIPADPDDTAIVEAIIAMSRRLQLQVVAEGVETEGQLDFLRENSCQRAQGWLFGKAVKLSALFELMDGDWCEPQKAQA